MRLATAIKSLSRPRHREFKRRAQKAVYQRGVGRAQAMGEVYRFEVITWLDSNPGSGLDASEISSATGVPHAAALAALGYLRNRVDHRVVICPVCDLRGPESECRRCEVPVHHRCLRDLRGSLVCPGCASEMDVGLP